MTGDNRWKKKGLKAKPIETKYKGRKFRSRLEAKWGVFFETLNISWEYEPEGFEFKYEGHIKHYLPDFYLRDAELWLEIKPIIKEVDNWPDHFVFHFQDEYENFKSAFRLIKGQPYVDFQKWDSGYFMMACADYMGFISYDSKYYFCECPWCGLIGIEFEGRAGRLPCGCIKKHKELPNGGKVYNPDKERNPASERLRKAYINAMSARFEHGENP